MGGSLTGCKPVPFLDPSEVQRLIVDLLWADPRGKTGYGPSYRVRHWWQINGLRVVLSGVRSFPSRVSFVSQLQSANVRIQHRVQRRLISEDVVCFVISKSAGGTGYGAVIAKASITRTVHSMVVSPQSKRPKSGTHQQSYSPQTTCTFVAAIAPEVGSTPQP